MTFAELLTEFYARGFDPMNDGGAGATRAGRWINQSYKAICEHEEWPFLYTDTTPGAAPVSITDLRAILSVTDTTNKVPLERVDRRTLVEWYPGLPDTGNPVFYYRDGETSLKVYPANTTATIAVRYVKFPADLTGSDTPVIPARWHDLIVDGAVIKAKKGKDDYDQLVQLYEAELQRMVASYAFADLSMPEYQVLESDRSWGWLR